MHSYFMLGTVVLTSVFMKFICSGRSTDYTALFSRRKIFPDFSFFTFNEKSNGQLQKLWKTIYVQLPKELYKVWLLNNETGRILPEKRFGVGNEWKINDLVVFLTENVWTLLSVSADLSLSFVWVWPCWVALPDPRLGYKSISASI